MKIICAVCLFCLISCAPQDIANQNSKGSSIVCFGDSLTQGFGAGDSEDYPSVLRRKLNLKVINAGVSGNTTRDALARLAQDVLSQDPKMVIITLGGNDFLQHIPIEESLRNMEAIIEQIQNQGAMVVWAHVKAGLLDDPYLDDVRKLAKIKRILLIDNILKGIMLNVEYKSDQIHPNAKGYALMAERIYQEIKRFIR